VLFVVATVAAIVGGSLLLPLDEPNYLEAVAASEAQIVTGALLEMLLVLSVVGIAVLINPVLRQRSEGMALAYVGSRLLEAVLLLAAAISALVVLGLSPAGGRADSQAVADVALVTREWTYLIGSTVMLGVSALILYGLLLAGRLVPMWLSVWGLAGGALILLRGLLEVYGVELSGVVQGLLAAPIGLNEMVLAAWLFVRGFDMRALPSVAAGTVAPLDPVTAGSVVRPAPAGAGGAAR